MLKSSCDDRRNCSRIQKFFEDFFDEARRLIGVGFWQRICSGPGFFLWKVDDACGSHFAIVSSCEAQINQSAMSI